MTKRLLLLMVFGLQSLFVFAQLPPPCPSNATPPSDICAQTCIYCNFNGMQSSTAGYTSQTPSGFCGSIENEQWLGFIAGEQGATFTALPSNCTNGDGIQVALYSSCSGSPLGCYGGMGGGGMTPATISVTGMIPGQNYFFMIDGFAGDQCDFVIVASPPSAITPPIPLPPTQIDGPTQVCPNGEYEYCVPPITGAGGYTWVAPADALINGMPPPATIVGNMVGNCVTITFGSSSGVICVNGANSCFTGPPLCQPVVVAPIPPTFLPDTSICAEDAPYVTSWGDVVTSTGSYEGLVPHPANCDSSVRQFVNVKLNVPTVLPPTALCNVETMEVCGVTYPSTPGTYTTTCVRSDGCDSTVTFIIIPRVIPPTIIPPTTLCPGESMSICGANYTDPGNFTVVCQGPTGCDSSVNFTIIQADLDATILGADNLNCNNSSVTLSYPPGPGTPIWYADYQFQPVGNGQTLDVTVPGQYILELQFAVGLGSCSAFDTVVISGDLDPPTVSTVGGVVGCGTTTPISVSTNANPATYMWSGGVSDPTSPNPTVSTPGTYVVTVTNTASGCTNIASAIVQGSTDIPVLSISGNDINCTIPTANLTANSSASNSTYIWSTSETTGAISVTTGGTYSVTVTDPANSCTNEESFVVDADFLDPDISAMSNGIITCANPNIDITSTSTTTGLTYNWNNSATTQDITVTNAGTYTLTVTGTNGCTNTATASVNEDTDIPSAMVDGGILTCDVNSLALTANTTSTGATYDWGSSNNQTFQVNTPGNYTVTITAMNGCTNTATATVTDDLTSPNATASGGIITCSVSSISLTGGSPTNGVQYEWTGPNGGVYTGQNPTVSETGTYTLIVTNPSNGCTSSATADVQPDAGIPNAAATGGTLDCNNTSISLNGSSTTAGANMTWNGPSGTLTGANPTVSSPGTYTLTVEDPSNGCTAIANTTVIEDLDTPQFSLSGGQLTCSQTDLQVQLIPDAGQGMLTFDWSGAGGLSSTDQNPLVSQPGVYTVVVTGENGCTSQNDVTVTSDNNIPQAMTQGGSITCDVSTVQIQLDITATGNVTSTEWTDASGTFVSSEEDPFVSQSGMYTVVVTLDNGCTSSANADIINDTDAPDILTSGGILGCTVFEVVLDATSQSGVSFDWLGPNGFSSTDQNPTVDADGVYSVIVTGANGCTALETATVNTDYASANINITGATLIDCNNPISTISTNINSPTVPVSTIEWTSANGYTSNVEDPDDITLPGTYDILVTTANGCTATSTIVIDEDVAVPDITTTDGLLTCVITQTQIIASSQTTGTSFVWETPNGNTSNQPNPTVLAAGTYLVTVTAPNGCTNTSSAEVILDGDFPDIAVSAAIETITCDNPQLTLVGSSTTPNTIFEWQDANSNVLSNDVNVIVDEAMTYTFFATDTTNGCFVLQEQIIDIDTDAPDANATGGTIDCISGTIDLSGTSTVPNAEFSWQGPTGSPYTGSSPSVSNIGTYTLIVEDPSNGCTTTTTADVLQNMDAPVASVAGTDELDCATPQVSLVATITSPAGATGTWTFNGAPIGSDATIMVSDSGLYVFTVINSANGCRATPQAVVTADYSTPQLSATGNLITCTNPNVDISATSTTPNVDFEWTDPNSAILSGAMQTVSMAGNYTVVATGANGCTSEEVTIVNQDIAEPNVSLSADVITCAVPTITLQGASLTSGAEFSWTGPVTLANISTPTTDVAGNYTLLVTDPNNGCTSEEMVVVTENITSPDLTAQGATLTCTVTSIGVSANSNTPGATFEWLLNGNSISTLQNPMVTEAATYTVIATDPVNGCTSETTAIVNPDANAPQVQAQGGEISCAIPNTTLSSSSVTPNVTFEWSGPNGFSSLDANPTVDAEGQYTLIVTALDNGCTTTQSAEVTGDFVAPSVDITQPGMIDCNNASVIVSSNATGTGSITYDWSALSGSILAGANSQNPEVGAGAYVLVVTDNGNGCTSEENVNVEADPATPSGAESTLRNISCFGETDGAVIIQGITGGTPPFLYSFNGGAYSAQSQWTNLLPGDYPMTVQDALGCEWSTVYTVVEPEELFLDLGEDLTLELGDSISISNDMIINFPERVEQYVVNPEEFYAFICDTCSADFYKAFYTNRYEVTILDSNGCKAVDDRLIIVDRTRNVYVPNVFNPDAPDINALLTVYGNTKHVTNIKSFKLFDRWGELVHEAYDFPPNNYDQAWDGRYQEKRMNPSVLVWVAEVEFVDGLIELYKGDVTIIGN